MTSPITICIPHELGRVEARRRIEAGFGKIASQLPGSIGAARERRDGDRLIFSVAPLGQTVSGVVEVFDATVTMEIDLSGVLGVFVSGIKERLQKAGQRHGVRRAGRVSARPHGDVARYTEARNGKDENTRSNSLAARRPKGSAVFV